MRISPASVDLGGVFIVPVEEDFRRTDAEVLQSIIRETVDTSWQPVIDVGLLTAPELRVRFNQPFSISGISGQEGLSGDRDNISGEQVFTLQDGMVRWNGKCYGKMEFRPASAESTFTLHRVKIGINFHWEREEDQMFSGGLTVLPAGEGLVAINSVPVEDYLLSVIRPMPSSRGRGCWPGLRSGAGTMKNRTDTMNWQTGKPGHVRTIPRSITSVENFRTRMAIVLRDTQAPSASSAGTTGRTTPSSMSARTTIARGTRDCCGPAMPISVGPWKPPGGWC